MDIRRTVLWVVFSLALLMLWDKWQQYNGVLFPAHIDINRPKDAYGVVMDVMDMKMNKAMTDDQFVLKKPEGAQLQVVGAAKESR